MPTPPDHIQTGRLLMRRWREEDREPFAAMNADPEVMRHFPDVMTRQKSDALVDRIEAHFEAHGFGLYVVEVPGVASVVGFVGLWRPLFDAHFTPCIEVGWRLIKAHWGNGYATEAARAAVAFGFEHLDLKEIVSFTIPANKASRRVMERIGMVRDPADDFDHPSLPNDSPLRRHVLYRIQPGK